MGVVMGIAGSKFKDDAMSKQKRDKRYRPKPNNPAGGLAVFGGCHARAEDRAPLKCDQLQDLGVAYWLAFENLRFGSASEESWSTVVCALNIALVLTEIGIGAEYESDINAALAGAFRAKVRGDKDGNFRLDGEALRDIDHALTVHDEQVKIASKAEILTAMRTIRQRIDDGVVYQAEVV